MVRAIPSAALAVLLPLLALLPLTVCGCDERADASTPDASAAQTPAPSGSARPSTAPSASASAAAEKAPLQLLKLVFTSEVKSREPVDKLDHAEPGQRVWAHFTLRNRGEGRTVSVVFRVNGDQRSRVDLKVDNSWSFRTWAYNTLRSSDASGEITVEARDEAGALVASASIPIKGADGAKPLHAKPEVIND